MLGIDARSSLLQLRSVRLRGVADGLRARQRFDTVLSDIDPGALGLPPQALLIVRRVAPAVRLRLNPSERVGVFAQAVHAELARSAQRARRPWLQLDAAGAGAVLFVDESELMACLVRDWLRGVLAERWWWPAVLRGLPAQEWLRRALLPRGDLLPAVMALLAPKGAAVAWITHLSEEEVAQATAAVTSAHALTALSYLVNSSLICPQAQETGMPSPSSPQKARQASINAQQHLIELIPELHVSTLTRMQRRLLAIALCLQRASSWARSAEFAIALQLLEAGTVAAAAADTATVGAPDKSQPSTEAVVKALSRGRGLGEGKSKSIDVFDPPHPNLASSARQTGPFPGPGFLPGGEGIPLLRHPRTDPGCAPDSLRSPTSKISDQVVVGKVANPASPAGGPVPGAIEIGRALSLQGIETQFGGVFYLLNVALAIGLYGDFTQPRAPGIALSPWDWLALVGRAWFGRAFERDAVWQLLAELAGRLPKQPPGCHFAPPETWSVPEDWLAPWDVDVLDVYATRNRVQVWHGAGFVLTDVPRVAGRTPLMQARALRDQYVTLRTARLVRLHKPPQRLAKGANGRGGLARWMRWVLAYLEARLGRALGHEEPAALATLVCCHPARLCCTSTTLDVHLSLVALPIEVRIAGLDRNPGWIPAAGRTLAFHFE